MTNKVNFGISKCLRPKTPALYVIATASLIAMMTVVVTSMSEHSVNAQMMMGNHGSFGNMTSSSSLHDLLEKEMASNGTINLQQTIFDAFRSKLKISLTQAMTTAERTVGNNSFAVAGFGGEYGRYFTYQIILGTPRMEFYTV